MDTKELQKDQTETLLAVLKLRFEKNMHRHELLVWANIEAKLNSNPDKLWSLN